MKTSSLTTIICLLLYCGSGESYTPVLIEQNLEVSGHNITLYVPEGMEVEFVTELAAPRFITSGPDNEFIIGSRSGSLYRIPFPYTTSETLVQLPGYYHSAVYQNGKLYAAETAGVWVAPYTGTATSLAPGDFSKLTTLPSATGGHSSRTIITGPDDNFYVGLGISGNCSDEYLDSSYSFELQRGGVFRMDAAGNLTPFASGLRNPIGLAFHPDTDILYATNAGPDNLGYDKPPEVLAALSQGTFHGMPWFQYYDGEFKSGECATSPPPRPAAEATEPVALFDARSTPEAIAFLQNSSLGQKYNGNALVAIHGSWAKKPGQGIESRRKPKLVMVNFDGAPPLRAVDLITGFQRVDGSRFARPCGIATGADGHVYFTSDSGEVTGLFRLVPVK